MFRRAGGSGVEMTARTAAHGAVAIDDGPKGTAHLEPHSSAEATAARDGTRTKLAYRRLRHIDLFFQRVRCIDRSCSMPRNSTKDVMRRQRKSPYSNGTNRSGGSPGKGAMVASARAS